MLEMNKHKGIPTDSRSIEIVARDPYLKPYADRILQRIQRTELMRQKLTQAERSLSDFASGHEYFGLHHKGSEWVFREWAPHAAAIFLVGDFSSWKTSQEYALHPVGNNGAWEITLPRSALSHGDLYRLHVSWNGGSGDRIPAWTRRVVQDESSKIFNAQVWDSPTPHTWRVPEYRRPKVAPLIYEAHIGMASEEGKIGSYQEFSRSILPRIAKSGYNTVQLMAVQEHPYYGSFGYQVSSFFAASSRFGTPEDLKDLIDTAHELGLNVIMDLVHSHAVKNEVEGLSRFDGTLNQYFHSGERGDHPAWNTRCFDYGKTEVLHFLLSNCRYWLDEYHFDGFRFDGVTSMIYWHHGLGSAFTSYDLYFDATVDLDSLVYLSLANEIIHELRPDALTVAEDVSGMPGLAAPLAEGGMGFDYRLAMGVPDYWIKLVKDTHDEDWHMGALWHELTNRRAEEKTISYSESHDQALVGDKTLMFRMADREMYTHMSKHTQSMVVDRAIALHKLIRLITLATAGNGYLNFMGNEFGHPEWIDFPREGNNWSFHYARRQWSLIENRDLHYHELADFDRVILTLARENELLRSNDLHKLWDHNEDKVLAFTRAELLFVFNFHPSRSFDGYGVPAWPGGYRIVLDSDNPAFGGFGRIDTKLEYQSQTEDPNKLLLYLPSRCALVLQRVDKSSLERT